MLEWSGILLGAARNAMRPVGQCARRALDSGRYKEVRPLRSKPSGAYRPIGNVVHVTGIWPFSTSRFFRSAVLRLAVDPPLASLPVKVAPNARAPLVLPWLEP